VTTGILGIVQRDQARMRLMETIDWIAAAAVTREDARFHLND
jgi:hypothetical protein